MIDKPADQTRSATTVRSIERAFDVLRLLALGPAGLTDVAAGAGLAKSTCLRILTTLEGLDAVRRDTRGNYLIGTGIAELARFGDSTAALIMALRPHLKDLAAETKEAAGFGIRIGDRAQHLVQEEAENAIQVRDYTGHSVPLHVAAAGLVILAHIPVAETEAYLSRELEQYTPKTVTDPEAIRERLSKIRADGYVWTIEEFAEGLSVVASPVFEADGSVYGAISVHGPTYRFPGAAASEIGSTVVEVARRISARRSA